MDWFKIPVIRNRKYALHDGDAEKILMAING